MTTSVEKRKHRRLNIRLPLEYQNQSSGRPYSGRSNTVDVCTGGVYFETTDDTISPGDTLSMVIGMANGNKRFPQNSKISTQAQITRTCIIPSDPEDTRPAFTRYGIAAKFTSDFKLSL